MWYWSVVADVLYDVLYLVWAFSEWVQPFCLAGNQYIKIYYGVVSDESNEMEVLQDALEHCGGDEIQWAGGRMVGRDNLSDFFCRKMKKHVKEKSLFAVS